MKILVGSAKGFAYLHATEPMPILHRDIKSENILLTNQANTRTPMMTELTISTSNRETLNSPNDKATASSVSTTDSTVSLRELSASLAPSAASSPPCS